MVLGKLSCFRKGCVVSGNVGGGGVHERLRGFEVSGGAGWFQEDCVVSGEAVWFQDRRGFKKGCVAGWFQGKAGWFQEVPCGFRKDRVVSGEPVWFHERGWFRVALGGV